MSVVTVNTRPQDNPNGFVEGALTPAGCDPNPAYAQMIGREDVEACWPEAGPRSLGFKG